MKKFTIKTRIIASVLSIVLIFSACSALSASAAQVKAEAMKAEYVGTQKSVKEIPEKA